MKSTKYSRFCKKIFGKIIDKFQIRTEEKEHLLEMADIRMTYEEYISLSMMNTTLSFLASLIVSITIYNIHPSKATFLIAILLLIFSPTIVFLYYVSLPDSKTKSRAKKIDALLPYVTNFIATMSSAGLAPGEIFKRLSNVDLYDEIQKEARKISKEIYFMGTDTITALKHAIERSPSRKFKDFIQGIISTIQSGSDLNKYFKNVVEKFMQEDIIERKKNLESLAIIAEIFVITVIAFPLFLVIIVSTMSLTSSGSGIPFNFLYLLSLFILPLAYLGFYFMMKSTAVEV